MVQCLWNECRICKYFDQFYAHYHKKNQKSEKDTQIKVAHTTTEDDLCTFPLFETDDVMNSKVNAMKSDFAYLFNVFSDCSVHYIEQNTCILDIHSISTEPFNIGIENKPHVLHISKDVTPEERREIENNINKICKSICLDI